MALTRDGEVVIGEHEVDARRAAHAVADEEGGARTTRQHVHAAVRKVVELEGAVCHQSRSSVAQQHDVSLISGHTRLVSLLRPANIRLASAAGDSLLDGGDFTRLEAVFAGRRFSRLEPARAHVLAVHVSSNGGHV